MIRALATGILHADPVQRIAANGNPYTTAKLRADGKDGAAVWCNLIAFNEAAERLASLTIGAVLSVSGRCEVSAWLNQEGEAKANLSIVVDEITTLKPKPRPQPEDDSSQQSAMRAIRPRRQRRKPTPVSAPTPTPAPNDFDDLDDWQP